ncbi:hypothetical protein [Cryptosporangium arvum]|uniref:hypothetical protein n=1 Tax=Cryptosporangium arvum TaxID=80871 RepID=UPI0004ADE82A|nr:hypothetical protein [Cryptosporangium arvum]
MENNAAEQLAAINDTRAAAADRLVTPWWYHPVLGLLLAGYVLGLSLGDTAVRSGTLAVLIVGSVLLVRVYRRITGVWVSGFNAGRAGRWAKGMGGLAALGLATAWGIAYFTDLRWPVWLIAALVLVGTIVLGRRFDDELRAQLRAGA